MGADENAAGGADAAEPAPPDDARAALDAVTAHARGDDLARLVHTIAFAAADERRAVLGDGLAEAAERAGLSAADADTPYGNVLKALDRAGAGDAGASARALLGALLARGVALSKPAGADAEARVARVLLWLAAHTPVDALPALDAAVGDGLWRAIGDAIRRIDAGRAPELGRAAALVAAAALRASESDAARAEAAAIAVEARDPVVRSLLRDAPASDDSRASAHAAGELLPRPRGPVAFVLLACTGLLAIARVARLVGRLALRYRCPAELRVTASGVTVTSRTTLLGRTLRERETHIPKASLLRATREVRYPRLALYAGLFALAVGSWVGVSLFVDGVRAGSPELLGVGALVVAFGVALDFALVNVVPSHKGKCRVVLLPRKGPGVALGELDRELADEALARLR